MRGRMLARRVQRPGDVVVVPPPPVDDGGWAGLGESYNPSGVWTGATMPTEPPPGLVTKFFDNFEGRTTLDNPQFPGYWGAYHNSFSGANPNTSWWDRGLVAVEDGMLKHKQVVRTRAHRNGVVDRRIESGTTALWGMPSGAYPQITMRARSAGPFGIEGITGTILMMWPNGESWPSLTEGDCLEESKLIRGRSNWHWGTDGGAGHRQTGFRQWAIPDTGTRAVFCNYTFRILPANHPTNPFRNEVWCNGVMVDSWTPPDGYKQTWPMLLINQTESYCNDNDTPTWTGPTGRQILDSLPTVPTDFLDIQWITIHRPS